MELNEIDIDQIVGAAKNVFCNGIYIKSNRHPCGWDFLTFENFTEEDFEDYKIEPYDINDGRYDYHNLDGLTLRQALEKIEAFWFEISNISDFKGYIWSKK